MVPGETPALWKGAAKTLVFDSVRQYGILTSTASILNRELQTGISEMTAILICGLRSETSN
jgi:hypothetical protein